MVQNSTLYNCHLIIIIILFFSVFRKSRIYDVNVPKSIKKIEGQILEYIFNLSEVNHITTFPSNQLQNFI